MVLIFTTLNECFSDGVILLVEIDKPLIYDFF